MKTEFERVNTIVQESIRLGLQWDVTVLDINQKIEYVVVIVCFKSRLFFRSIVTFYFSYSPMMKGKKYVLGKCIILSPLHILNCFYIFRTWMEIIVLVMTSSKTTKFPFCMMVPENVLFGMLNFIYHQS